MARELRVAFRSHEHACPCQAGELQREDGNSPRALNEHRVSRFDATAFYNRIPCRHAGTGERRRFFKGQVVRNRHQPVLGKHCQLGEQSVAAAAQGRSCLLLVRRPVNPTGHEAGGDALAWLETRRSRAGRDDLAGTVGDRNEGKAKLGVVETLAHEQVSEIKRESLQADEDLTGAGDGIGQIVEPEPARTAQVVQPIRFHDWPSPSLFV